MTRATLLHVLDRPTALGAVEVRELEQLALAFPYCQTAHLLLAKAAHDQGTMLAGQRLRRAATYAADRTLLRRLIEQVEPAIEPVIVEEPALLPAAETLNPQAEIVAPPLANLVKETPVAEPVAVDEPAAAATVEQEALPELMPEILPRTVPEIQPEAELVMAPEAAPVSALFVAEPEPAPELLPLTVAPLLAAEAPIVAATPIESEEAPAPITASPAEPVVLEERVSELPTLIDEEGADILVLTALPEAELAPEEDLPAQAPAIRPSVEVGEARFEFGLAEAPAPALPTTYELPGLIDEWAASAVTRSLGSPMLVAERPILIPAPIIFTPAAFTGDTTVGYAFGESSRLGFSMQLLDLLTAKAETAESATAVVAAAQPPAVPLPPAGAFFEPDPLLLDHWAMHCPTPPAQPSSLDLINNFLRRQPRLTRPAMLPPAASHQADLSVRSTRAEPDLVSENLARIFVRQGKTARAIEIYEKLMVKQPEKMAYFTAQIQSLQPSA